jgi:ABC-type molybdate transport system substrate-binding protein
MHRILSTLIGGTLAVSLVAGCATKEPAAAAAPKAAAKFATIPPNKDNDLKLYLADGRIVKGADALGRMQGEADLILWLAGNQFFAMDDVIKAFQKQSPGTRVGIITLPPGLLLNAIEGGGWAYGGKDYPGLPDVYASVNLDHLKRLKKAGLMDTYAIYLHNEMELMVAAGNPKGIKGIKDLARPDIRTSMPNPVNEGIMRFYGKKVLQRNGVWSASRARPRRTTGSPPCTIARPPSGSLPANRTPASSGSPRRWKPSATAPRSTASGCRPRTACATRCRMRSARLPAARTRPPRNATWRFSQRRRRRMPTPASASSRRRRRS